MTTDETPTPGPELDSVYQPGNPGATWTRGEVVLMIIMMMIMIMMIMMMMVMMMMMRL